MPKQMEHVGPVAQISWVPCIVCQKPAAMQLFLPGFKEEIYLVGPLSLPQVMHAYCERRRNPRG